MIDSNSRMRPRGRARHGFAAFCLVALLATSSTPARADDPPAKADAAAAPARAGAPAKKVLRLEEFTVEGRLQKPQAFFILPRNNQTFDDGDKKESFLPKIVKTCDKDPF